MIYRLIKALPLRCAAIMLMGLLACLNVSAADRPVPHGKHTILVVSAYHEDEPWGIKMMLPLNNHFLSVDSVDIETAYLSNFAIPDSDTYVQMVDNLFDKYSQKRPTCVILLGNFTFSLRDRIKQEWGDEMPFLVISRVEGVGPLSDYFAGGGSDESIDKRQPMSSFRDDYNFTAVLSPDYPKATVDLMMRLIPDMREFVFMADPSYVNRVASYNIYNYLLEEYPQVEYKWLVADESNSYEFRHNLGVRDEKRGLLVSSWAYNTESLLGDPLLTTKELSHISGSVNPVFTLRVAYMSLGCVGGVFSENEAVSNEILKRTEQMLRGESMRDVPFFYPQNMHAEVDYRLLEKYDLKADACPEGTVFRNRPASFLERYWLVTLLVTLFVVVLIVLLLTRTRMQSRRIAILRKHTDFVDNMPLPYGAVNVILNSNNRLVDVVFIKKNKAYEQLIANNTNPEDPMHLLPSKLVAEKARELLEGKKSLSFAYHLECTHSFYDFMYYLTGVTIREDGVKVVSIDVFARNVTAQHNIQDKLLQASEHLEMAVEVANIQPWQLDWHTKMITREKDLEAISRGENSVSMSYHLNEYLDRVIPEDRHILEKALSELDSLKYTDRTITYRVYDPERTHIDWVQNRMKVVEKSENGSVSKIIGTQRIITTEKEREERLQTALEKARESDKMKSVFLANMSHEIRTPLNAIVGFSNLLANLDDDEDPQEIIDVITRNNDLLLTLINDIIDLAKIESDNIDLAQSECDVESLLDSVGKTIEVRLPKGVKLNVVHYSDHLEAVIDPSRVSQILINFLVNACKFTTQGSITLGVEKRDNGSMLYFFVRDTGIGIDPADQEKVFERFLKLDQFSQGTGLGLAISKTLVEKMGGKIGVMSEGRGYGSTFWFEIPYMV